MYNFHIKPSSLAKEAIILPISQHCSKLSRNLALPCTMYTSVITGKFQPESEHFFMHATNHCATKESKMAAQNGEHGNMTIFKKLLHEIKSPVRLDDCSFVL